MNLVDRVTVIQSMGDPRAGLYMMCYCRVCAHKDATDEEILAVCNRENPSGTENGWVDVVREKREHGDDMDKPPWPGPVVCAGNKDRVHLLVLC